MKREKSAEIPLEVQQKLREIGLKVRNKRRAIEKNYEIFAQTNHINKVTLSRIENGENFTMSSFIQVLSAMGITLEQFFSGDTK